MGRNKKLGAMFLLSALVTALLAMTALGASAQQYPPGTETDGPGGDSTQDDTAREELPPGAIQVFVCVGCYDPFTTVSITIFYSGDGETSRPGLFLASTAGTFLAQSSTTQTFTTESDADGSVRFEFEVPEDAPEGTAQLTAEGTLDGAPAVYNEAFEVDASAPATVDDDGAAPDDGDEVAATGAGVTNLMLLAALVVVLGGGALAYAKSRGAKDEEATTKV